MDILDLNPDVKSFLDEGRLEMGHARALLGLKDAQQSDAARQVISQGLSVRETEKLVRRARGEEPGATGKDKAEAKLDPNVRALEGDLTEKLGALVKVQQGKGGKGKLVISYNSLDELEGILEHIQ